jgi:hypothetical protein
MSSASLLRERDPAGNASMPEVVGANVTVFVFALVVYALRIYSRLKPRPGYRPRLDWDDYAVSLGVVSCMTAYARSR